MNFKQISINAIITEIYILCDITDYENERPENLDNSVLNIDIQMS